MQLIWHLYGVEHMVCLHMAKHGMVRLYMALAAYMEMVWYSSHGMVIYGKAWYGTTGNGLQRYMAPVWCVSTWYGTSAHGL